MDIYDLESFLTIVEKGNFSRAAEKLSLTQSALSQRIRQLEDELRYSLLSRRKGRQAVELTEQGRSFAGIAEQMLLLWAKAQEPGSQADGPERLNISIIDSVINCTIPALIPNFINEYSDVKVAISGYHSIEAYQHIENNDVDLAIVGKLSRAQGAISYPIYSDPLVFICGKDANYPEVVHPAELDNNFQLLLCNSEVDDWQEYWFSTGINPKFGANKISYTNKHLFEGEAWAVLPFSIARFLEQSANGVIHEIKDGPAPRIIYLVQSKKANQRAVRKFKTSIYQELQKVPGITLMFQPDEP